MVGILIQFSFFKYGSQEKHKYSTSGQFINIKLLKGVSAFQMNPCWFLELTVSNLYWVVLESKMKDQWQLEAGSAYW
jgi:hypothetical protein